MQSICVPVGRTMNTMNDKSGYVRFEEQEKRTKHIQLQAQAVGGMVVC